MKYSQWLNIWLEHYVKPTVKRRTYEKYLKVVNQHIVGKIGEENIENITSFMLQKFITSLMQSGNILTSKGLAPNSVNGIITIIQSSLKLAYINGQTKEYLGNQIKRPRLKEKVITCFTIQEQKIIEQMALTDSRDKMFGIVICLYSGVRIGELLSLKWSDVDFLKGTILISRTSYDTTNEIGKLCRAEDTPKTTSSRRLIPLPDQLIKLLQKYKKRSVSEYIISNGTKPVYVRSYQKSFELLLQKAGIKHQGFHSLRHTFATRALECGMDVKTLAEILGHKNPTVTLNRYAHSMMEHKKAMMNKLGKAL